MKQQLLKKTMTMEIDRVKKFTIAELQWAIEIEAGKHKGLEKAPPEMVRIRINDEYNKENTVEEIKAALDCLNEVNDYELESRRIEYGVRDID